MYREPHVLCGLSFCEACHFVRPIPVILKQENAPVWVAHEIVKPVHEAMIMILGRLTVARCVVNCNIANVNMAMYDG